MREKTLKVYRQPSIEKAYPEIRLSGRWLMKNGFQIGDYIKIAYSPSVIVIKKIVPYQPNAVVDQAFPGEYNNREPKEEN